MYEYISNKAIMWDTCWPSAIISLSAAENIPVGNKKIEHECFFFFLMGGVFVCFVLFGFTSLNILLSLYGRNEFFVAKMMTEMNWR